MAAGLTSRESWPSQEPRKVRSAVYDEEDGLVLEESTARRGQREDRERHSNARYHDHYSRKRPRSMSPPQSSLATTPSYHGHQKGSKSEPWRARGEFTTRSIPHDRNEAQPLHPRSSSSSNHKDNNNMCNTPFRGAPTRPRNSDEYWRNNERARNNQHPISPQWQHRNDVGPNATSRPFRDDNLRRNDIRGNPKPPHWQHHNDVGPHAISRPVRDDNLRRNDIRGDPKSPQWQHHSDMGPNATAGHVRDDYHRRNDIRGDPKSPQWQHRNDVGLNATSGPLGDDYHRRNDIRGDTDTRPRDRPFSDSPGSRVSNENTGRDGPRNTRAFSSRDRGAREWRDRSGTGDGYLESRPNNEFSKRDDVGRRGPADQGRFNDRRGRPYEESNRIDRYSNRAFEQDQQFQERRPVQESPQQYKSFPNRDVSLDRGRIFPRDERSMHPPRFESHTKIDRRYSDRNASHMERPRYEESASQSFGHENYADRRRTDGPSRFLEPDNSQIAHPRDVPSGSRFHSSNNHAYLDQRTVLYDHGASKSMHWSRPVESEHRNDATPVEHAYPRNAWNQPTEQSGSPRSFMPQEHSPAKQQWPLEEATLGSTDARKLGEQGTWEGDSIRERGLPLNLHSTNATNTVTFGVGDVATTVRRKPQPSAADTLQDNATVHKSPLVFPTASATEAKKDSVSISQPVSIRAKKASLAIPSRWLKPVVKPRKPATSASTKGSVTAKSVSDQAVPRKAAAPEKKVAKSGGSSCPSSPSLNRLVTDSEGGSTISNNLILMVEGTEDLQQVPTAIVTNLTPSSKIDNTEDDISKSDTEFAAKSPATKLESDSSSESDSSDESDTDDEEVMMWASKMFGVPVRASPSKLAGSGAQPVEEASPRKTLRLKLKVPRPKQQQEPIQPSLDKMDKKLKKKRKRNFQDEPPRGNAVVKKKKRGRPKKIESIELDIPIESVQEETKQIDPEEERMRKESAKPLTAAQIKAILGEDDFSASVGTNWVRRSVRQPSKDLLNAKPVKALVEKLKNSHPDMMVLKMKKFINDPNAPQVVIDAALDALEENTNCQTLYIQNFNEGMRDDQVLHLLKILQQPQCKIWCLNIGENYNVKTKTWDKFTKGLKKTKVTHMYASEHTITTEMKDEIRATIRNNRMKHDMHINPNNLHVIVQCTHCWWNPINAKVLRPYLKNEGFEHILRDKEAQGLRGSTSAAPSV